MPHFCAVTSQLNTTLALAQPEELKKGYSKLQSTLGPHVPIRKRRQMVETTSTCVAQVLSSAENTDQWCSGPRRIRHLLQTGGYGTPLRLLWSRQFSGPMIFQLANAALER